MRERKRKKDAVPKSEGFIVSAICSQKRRITLKDGRFWYIGRIDWKVAFY